MTNHNYDRDKSIERLSKLWNFWMKTRWYLVGLLFIIMIIIFVKKDNFGNMNMVVVIIAVILAFLVLIIFNDKWILGNPVNFIK
jgi:cell division protein FtsW (lipid II flippase)